MAEKNILKGLLYIPKHAEPEKPDKIISIIMPSVVGIILCLACLFGLTWAWFADSTSSKTTGVSFSTFDYTIVVSPLQNNGEDEQEVPCLSSEEEKNKGIFKYSLESGKSYIITFAVTEDNTANGYYTLQKNGNSKYYVGPVNKENDSSSPFIRKIQPQTEGIYTLTSQWGSYSGQYNLVNSDDIYAID